MWGSRQDQETISTMSRVASQTIASTWASPGPADCAGNQKIVSLQSHSHRSARSSPGPPNERELVGDTGASGPQNWIDAFRTESGHMMVTLHAISPEAMTTIATGCRLCSPTGMPSEKSRESTECVTETGMGSPPSVPKFPSLHRRISMTTIRGGPERYTPDHQQPCEPGYSFLLDDAENYFCLSLGNSL